MKDRDSPRRKKARGLLARHGYAVGGHVEDPAGEAAHRPAPPVRQGRKAAKPRRRSGAADGTAPRARADTPRRAGGGRVRKAGTKIIIVNGQPQPQPVPVPRPVPVPVGAAARPPLAAPPAGAPVPSAAPIAGPRPPMAKRGGRIGGRRA